MKYQNAIDVLRLLNICAIFTIVCRCLKKWIFWWSWYILLSLLSGTFWEYQHVATLFPLDQKTLGFIMRITILICWLKWNGYQKAGLLWVLRKIHKFSFGYYKRTMKRTNISEKKYWRNIRIKSLKERRSTSSSHKFRQKISFRFGMNFQVALPTNWTING